MLGRGAQIGSRLCHAVKTPLCATADQSDKGVMCKVCGIGAIAQATAQPPMQPALMMDVKIFKKRGGVAQWEMFNSK